MRVESGDMSTISIGKEGPDYSAGKRLVSKRKFLFEWDSDSQSEKKVSEGIGEGVEGLHHCFINLCPFL
jgi:hypothetical protein